MGEEALLYSPYTEESYVEGNEKEGKVHNLFKFPFINEEDLYEAPSWAKEIVWYRIFPEHFADGDNRRLF